METRSPGSTNPVEQIDLTGAGFVGDSGSGGQKGIVPAPAAGDASKFLRVMERGLRYLVDRAALQSVGIVAPANGTYCFWFSDYIKRDMTLALSDDLAAVEIGRNRDSQAHCG